MNHSDLPMFMEYVIKSKSDKYTPALDLISYVMEFNPVGNTEGYIKYELNGKNEESDFGGKPIINLLLNEKELETLKITGFNKITCKAFYMGGISDAIKESSNKITVEKTITGGTKVGDTVTTTIKIKFPNNAQKDTYYTLTDVVPSGMRYTGYNKQYNSNYYLREQELQKLYFTIRNKDNSEVTITYNSRNILPGEYFIDSALIENPQENMKGYSTTSSFIITEQ